MTWWELGAALWLGILTAISPCPLTANIAAMSFIGRNARHPRLALIDGLLLALGQSVAYVTLAVLIVAGLGSSGLLSVTLQRYVSVVLGPVLIIAGLILLGWLRPVGAVALAGTGIQARVAAGGRVWSLVLGILLALSFCPTSAAWFFGALIPLALKSRMPAALAVGYGIGAALPVLVFSVILAFAAKRLGSVFERIANAEQLLRIIAGGVLVIAGIVETLMQVYGVRIIS